MYTHLSAVIYVVLSINVYEWSTVLTVYSQSHTILANVYMQVRMYILPGTMLLHHMACVYISANFPLTWEIALFDLALVYSVTCDCKVVMTVVGMMVHGCHMHTSSYLRISDAI